MTTPEFSYWSVLIGIISGIVGAFLGIFKFLRTQKSTIEQRAAADQKIQSDLEQLEKDIEQNKDAIDAIQTQLEKQTDTFTNSISDLNKKIDIKFDKLNETLMKFLTEQASKK